MDYIVDGIPGKASIDPDAGQQRQRKRERPVPKKESGDSISISDEARRRSAQQDGAEQE